MTYNLKVVTILVHKHIDDFNLESKFNFNCEKKSFEVN